MIDNMGPEDRAHDDAARSEDEQALVMSHREMNAAYLSGQAVPLAQSVSWLGSATRHPGGSSTRAAGSV